MASWPKPSKLPINPRFSSGPCAKRPGWTLEALAGASLGRSHRSVEGRARLKLAIAQTKELLRLPAGYEVAIVPGSDTGAFEMAMWNLLGPRGVDVFAWEVFGRIWLKDALDELRIKDLRTFDAEWGHLPDLAQADFSRDVLFTWNGTTTGVCVPNGNWVPDGRQGLTFCDATSALFSQDIDFSKIDVLTYSWQKALGGEAAHGMLILSPRALQRLATHTPSWPVPKVFRLKDKAGIQHEIFEGVTINTPSMLCVEDYLDALRWVESIGGLDAAIATPTAIPRSSMTGWRVRPGLCRWLLTRGPTPRRRSACVLLTMRFYRVARTPRSVSQRRWRRCWIAKAPHMTSWPIAACRQALGSGQAPP